jgi:phage baseplate assembly protein W
MAQRIPNQFPVDLQAGTALGLSLPFNGSGDAVFSSNYTTQDQTKSNLINYFLTNKGERPMQPNFGANLRADIFEMVNNQTYDLLKLKVETEIKNNFPNVSVSDIEVLGSEDYNTIQIIIYYNIVPFGITDQLNLTFN